MRPDGERVKLISRGDKKINEIFNWAVLKDARRKEAKRERGREGENTHVRRGGASATAARSAERERIARARARARRRSVSR